MFTSRLYRILSHGKPITEPSAGLKMVMKVDRQRIEEWPYSSIRDKDGELYSNVIAVEAATILKSEGAGWTVFGTGMMSCAIVFHLFHYPEALSIPMVIFSAFGFSRSYSNYASSKEISDALYANAIHFSQRKTEQRVDQD